MKRHWMFSFFIVCLAYLLAGCSTYEAEAYEGAALKIAVAGTAPPYELSEVEFEEVHIDELVEAAGQYDALFIMEETFDQTSQDNYISLYESLPYPTFFIGLDKPIEVFVSEGFSLSDFTEDMSTAFAQGYYKHDSGTLEWTFVPSTPEEELRSLYVGIFKVIDDFNRDHF
ncbi:hypothetical protein [Planococcus lenghuensis]|uniref:Lipoprotein n=1 Tax=Planococcus lenghuensis TaxID=2213202 RepID=A0A1Q2KYI1_9BACL|nr:hypothetical protein [Planococcus lenghuensis]AQQ53213.1 hypothetical protein B0X71_09065 [Planococcus lenghuensis]